MRFGASFSHDARGKILTETAPDGEVVRTGYDSFGRESSLSGAAVYVSSTAYNALDLPTSRVYGNGRTATATYYDAGTAEKTYRLQSPWLGQAGGGDLLHLTYAYDATGNLTQLVDAVQGDRRAGTGACPYRTGTGTVHPAQVAQPAHRPCRTGAGHGVPALRKESFLRPAAPARATARATPIMPSATSSARAG